MLYLPCAVQDGNKVFRQRQRHSVCNTVARNVVERDPEPEPVDESSECDAPKHRIGHRQLYKSFTHGPTRRSYSSFNCKASYRLRSSGQKSVSTKVLTHQSTQNNESNHAHRPRETDTGNELDNQDRIDDA